MIKLENVSKSYKSVKAVDDVSLEVKMGEIIGLIGPNGAGKTTIIKMIAQLTLPDKGKIFIKNNQGVLQDIFKNPSNLISQGYLVDNPHFYKMTANDLLKFFAQIQRYPSEKIQKRIDGLLKKFNLLEWKNENVKTFSKGMVQKLGLIQAVVHNPKFIILDEPQTGLDPHARVKVRKFIKELRDEGKTIFLSSHLLYEITELCDRIALINHGKMIAFDKIDRLEGRRSIKELECILAEPIEEKQLREVLSRISKALEPYLPEKMSANQNNLSEPIQYDFQNHVLRIYHLGDNKIKSKILNMLITEFGDELSLASFSESKTSKLEKFYSEFVSYEN